MITLKNPVSVSTARKGVAWLYTDPCSKTGAGVLMMSKKIENKKGDLINGFKYVRGVTTTSKDRRAIFICPKCFKECEARISHIRANAQESCGCTAYQITNKYYKTKLYRLWDGIKQRCYNEKSPNYKNYGAMGVSMYNEWIDNYTLFIKYCMTLDGHDNNKLSLDRINPYGDYVPGNLRFTTSTVQNRNRRISPKNKTGFVGVRIVETMTTLRYCSNISVNDKTIFLGSFNTAEDAVKVRDQYIIDNNLEGFKLQTHDVL